VHEAGIAGRRGEIPCRSLDQTCLPSVQLTLQPSMQNSGRLSGKTTVLVGGAGQLGSSFARRILREGGSVVLADRDTERGQSFAARLAVEHPNNSVKFMSVDICDTESVRRLIANANSSTGRIDAVVNAGYPRGPRYGTRLEDVTYEDFCTNVNLHIGGYFLVSQLFALFFKQQGYGNIVNLASIYGVVAPRFGIYESTSMTMPVEYAVVKAGLLHLNKYFARYFPNSGIRFNCISPGGILNGQAEGFLHKYNAFGLSKGMLDADDVGGALIFLLSDDSQYVNGQNLIVDDGWTL
jgi:NAD(P)-dependent dehydrogenase (short-subunit alcohol dehydrogenase family)